ncbi:MAG: TonB-dependent receptor [Alphaproteobacteria bacterium]|nr:TonB-dependent receptor [Alphaproteobacteria bacterium]
MSERTSTAGYKAPAVLTLLLASTMLSGVPAHAQQGGIETVTVTAEKRSEDLQNVPMNIQAITAEKLDALHLTNFTDFALYMPSVTFAVSGQGSNGGPGFSNVSMRGVVSDQNGNHSGPLPTVGVYFDEQPISTINGTLDIPTYDVARVEALSGPNGTLYGASAEAGVIRIISNRPSTDGFEANYEASVNAVEHGGIGYGAHGMLNAPLADNMALRIVAWAEHDAGYIDNVAGSRTYSFTGFSDPPLPPGLPDIVINNAGLAKKNYNDVDKYGARVALQIDLDDNWTILPSIMAQDEKTNGVFGYDPSVGDLAVTHFVPEYVKDKWYQASLTVEGKIANLDMVYSGGYMRRTIDSQADYSDYTYWYDQYNAYYVYFQDNFGNQIDPTQHIFGKDTFTKESHELRFTTPKEYSVRGVFGAFYEKQTHAILQDYEIPNLDDTLAVTGWPDTLWLTDQHRQDVDYALFGEVSMDLRPDITLTGGIRVFKADNSLKGFFGFSGNFSGSTGEAACFKPATVAGAPCTNLDKRLIETGETHKVNITWHLEDDKMIYATYSTGFRPGGVNRRTGPGIGPYASDTLTNYEIGWKTSWLDNTLRANGALFYEQWNDFQFPFLGPNSLTIIFNGGQARTRGVEWDLTWLPVDNLTLTTSGAYIDAQLTSDYCGVAGVSICPGTAQAPKGTQMPITPKWKLNAVARYEFELAGLDAHVQGSVVHQSGTYSDLRIFERNLLGMNKAFTTFDFTTGFDANQWSVELFVKNVFDERAQLGRYAACTTGVCGSEPYILASQPRTVGLTIGQKF